MIGDLDSKRPGGMVWHWPKPIPGNRAAGRPADMGLSDDFARATLSPQWEWNHQPRSDRWSLTERPGRLRLRGWPQLVRGDLRRTRNLLGRRSVRTRANGQVERMNRTIKEATVKRYHYETHNQFRQHLTDFVAAYNFARRLKTLRSHLQSMDGLAGKTLHIKPAPSIAGTKHLALLWQVVG